ncbi:hypothetical protein QO010_002189 [Caulobacter ginsengisoli]|uniref:Pvc16 N-terminal domain-containing protein n=1 Tax=Caulobacter ginsengisoli TaxID=400775 RepID=A0ABU0IQX3_9CAUL|nr:Pvc16 family protein [Caulobacter ginsengisoli]MDQ0464408.1 hypothetical protein [Caulobacter ginsengisoli]
MAFPDTLDLSSVTDELVKLVRDAVKNSALWAEPGIKKFTVHVTGKAPEVVRDDNGCQLTLSLMHVGSDPAWRNTFPNNDPAVRSIPQLSTRQPIGLVLTYLMTAYEEGGAFHHEQQAMSMALTCFHAQPFHSRVAGGPRDFVMVVEQATLDELSRLWQSITVPMRLSALLRVAVVFLRPPETPPPPAKPVKESRLLAGAGLEPLAEAPQLFQTGSTISYLAPKGGGAETLRMHVSPAVAAPGALLSVGGNALKDAKIYLSKADGSGETDITAWRQTPAAESEIVLKVPTGAGAPASGLHRLAVGPGAGGPDRSPAIPISIVPSVTVPGPLPILVPVAGLYTVDGAGFTPGDTAVLLGADALTPGGAAGPGVFAINAGGTQITFKAPAGQPPGRYPLRLRVADIEAPPAWWIDIP